MQDSGFVLLFGIPVSENQIYQDILENKLSPNHTHGKIVKMINQVELMNHFLRGYFDGDGFISDYESKPGSRPRFSVIGNKEFMEGFQEVLIKNTGLNINKLMTKPKIPTIRILEYGGTNVVKTIREYLYKNATIFLERKKQRFDKII